MKLFQYAKENGYTSTDVLRGLKEAGVEIKTPLSNLTDEALAKAKELFPASAIPKERVTPVDFVPEAKPVVETHVDKLKARGFDNIQAEGLPEGFTQYIMGIRRRFVDGKKQFSVLTYAINPDTLEVKLVKEEEKKTDSAAILNLKENMVKRKIV